MRSLFAGVSFLALAAGAPALAELRPADIVDRLERLAALAEGHVDYTLDERADGSIVLSDLTLRDEDGEAFLRQTGGEIVFAPIEGDYEVEITGLDGLAFDVAADGGAGEVTTFAGDYSYLLRGSAERVESRFVGESFGVRGTSDIVIDGEPIGETEFEAVYEGMESTAVTDYVARQGEGTYTVARVRSETTTRDASTGAQSRSLTVADDSVYRTAWSNLLLVERLGELATDKEADLIVLDDSVQMSGTGGLTRSVTQTSGPGGEDLVVDMTLAASAMAFDLAEGAMALDVSMGATQAKIAGAMLPFPKTSFGFAGLDMTLGIPIVARPDGQGRGRMALDLSGLEMSDSVWSMFDPQGALPRDPATLALDLGFVAELAGEIAKGADGDKMTSFELTELTIDRLELQAVGVDLSASGALDFGDTGEFSQPEGQLDAEVTGLNGLIDTLLTMGLLPPEAMMGLRMMMGAMLVPGDGPDSYTSRIEIGEDGSVTANGVPLR